MGLSGTYLVVRTRVPISQRICAQVLASRPVWCSKLANQISKICDHVRVAARARCFVRSLDQIRAPDSQTHLGKVPPRIVRGVSVGLARSLNDDKTFSCMNPDAFCFMQPHFPPLASPCVSVPQGDCPLRSLLYQRCDRGVLCMPERHRCDRTRPLQVLCSALPRTNCSSMSRSIHSGCSSSTRQVSIMLLL